MIDANGQSLAYVYSRETKDAADIAKVLTEDEARRIASNIPSCQPYSVKLAKTDLPLGEEISSFSNPICKRRTTTTSSLRGLRIAGVRLLHLGFLNWGESTNFTTRSVCTEIADAQTRSHTH